MKKLMPEQNKSIKTYLKRLQGFPNFWVRTIGEWLDTNTDWEKQKVIKRWPGRPRTSVPIDFKKLKKLMVQKGIKQSELAKSLGYSESRVSQFESGHLDGVPLLALKEIGEILEIDYTELLLSNKVDGKWMLFCWKCGGETDTYVDFDSEEVELGYIKVTCEDCAK